VYIGQVVGQGIKLEADDVCFPRVGGEPCPLHRNLAVLDLMLRPAALIIEGDDMVRGPGQVGGDKPEAGIQFPGWRSTLATTRIGPAPDV
jgi:hypothetical protein